MDKEVDNRLATIDGHIKAVRKMYSEDSGCVNVITQLMAIEKAVKKASILILRNHLNNCVKSAVATKGENAEQLVMEFSKILEMYL